MYKIKPFSVSRSSTKQQLPTIAARTPRSGGIVHSKSYLGQISKQFSGNAEYDQMDNSKLTKQQRKLKDILRKMNEDTVKIISDFTPRGKKQQHHRTATTILAINEQQQVNNHKIMVQCQTQIGKLQERAEGLLVGGKQLYDQQIGKMEEEVFALQEENKNLRNQNDRRGKSIVNQNRIIQEGEIRKMETDVYLAEHRASHLRADDLRVTEEIKQYEKKLKQLAEKWSQADKFLKQQQKKEKEKTNLKLNEHELIHKKTVLQNIIKKNQFYNQNCQYRYLSLLRQLDLSTTSSKQLQSRIDKVFVSTEASKMIISKLQNQLRTIKQKKKQKQQQINEFLNKTRNQNMQSGQSRQNGRNGQNGQNGQIGQIVQNGSKLSELDNKDLLSQIEINQQINGDNSAIDIEQAIVGLAEKKTDSKRSIRAKVNKYEDLESGKLFNGQEINGQHRNDMLL